MNALPGPLSNPARPPATLTATLPPSSGAAIGHSAAPPRTASKALDRIPFKEAPRVATRPRIHSLAASTLATGSLIDATTEIAEGTRPSSRSPVAASPQISGGIVGGASRTAIVSLLALRRPFPRTRRSLCWAGRRIKRPGSGGQAADIAVWGTKISVLPGNPPFRGGGAEFWHPHRPLRPPSTPIRPPRSHQCCQLAGNHGGGLGGGTTAGSREKPGPGRRRIPAAARLVTMNRCESRFGRRRGRGSSLRLLVAAMNGLGSEVDRATWSFTCTPARAASRRCRGNGSMSISARPALLAAPHFLRCLPRRPEHDGFDSDGVLHDLQLPSQALG